MKECNFSSVKLDLVRGLTEVLPWDSRNICQPIPNPDFEKLDLEQIDHKQDEARFNHDLLMQIQHFREIIIDNKVQIRVALIHGQVILMSYEIDRKTSKKSVVFDGIKFRNV